ncbi:endonuclease/exonuclease/phosphatase family protein [Christiangramia sediminis]|uniref:Endonuclease/exonuclease/phosphatase family protein n=1 Tax=Christiangramia sediminis TaxID=2881336 RepID=A0A9X1LGF7_9FLAO|nr:endonuclease/exonuclease/phosphatase family protein [Christiangramia sediminis]MCB7479832.1 endonuclease/exonuclease/phosphatase family protein [Christiangramia sediminis]
MKVLSLKNLTWLLIIGVLLVSFLPNIISNYWLIDIFSNFKFQYLVISVLLVFPTIFFLKKKLAALLMLSACFLWNFYYIVPYYIKSENFNSGKEVKITSINLFSSNSQDDLVLKYINQEDPDILILMELTPNWLEKLSPIMDKYKSKEIVPRSDNFGIALLSKYKMRSAIDYFELNNKPSIVSDLKIENHNFSIIATHPVPPISQETFENRNKQLANIILNRPRFSDNLIIVGDFNTSSFSNHFNQLINKDLKDSRFGFGLLPTWPASLKVFQTTLDHILVSDHLKVIERNTGPDIGSDHLPINLIIGVN